MEKTTRVIAFDVKNCKIARLCCIYILYSKYSLIVLQAKYSWSVFIVVSTNALLCFAAIFCSRFSNVYPTFTKPAGQDKYCVSFVGGLADFNVTNSHRNYSLSLQKNGGRFKTPNIQKEKV